MKNKNSWDHLKLRTSLPLLVNFNFVLYRVFAISLVTPSKLSFIFYQKNRTQYAIQRQFSQQHCCCWPTMRRKQHQLALSTLRELIYRPKSVSQRLLKGKKK